MQANTPTHLPGRQPLSGSHLQQTWPFLLPAAVFILHTMEEIQGFAAWATRHFGEETTEAFVGYHIPLVLLVGLFSLRAIQPGRRRGWVVAASACQWQFGLNALFHLATWVAFGEYSPGAFTGAVLSLPATVYFFVWLRRGNHASTPRNLAEYRNWNPGCGPRDRVPIRVTRR